ncbi:radical SAM family heme chaperone HemW [Campylobacter sp. JMF_11 EL3]|uniref:radical SAM family heme chaperone HemW n=1 Tax=Campylobacter sp. JMF_11 EL3 TaxID=2983841 RepID=UPI002FDC694F
MHIYIHIPFCTSKCPYCAFGSRMDAFKLAKNYFDALDLEISNFIKKNKNFKISTLFIGGGTPSMVSAQYYEKIFEKLSPNFAPDAEITTEANPNSAKPKWIEQMRKFGVNRISFGAQSFNDEKLKFLGRTHGKNEIFEAVDNAKNTGISNINLDLIYASKFDDKQNLEFELAQFARARVSHLSAYALTLEPGTPFFGRAQSLPKMMKIWLNFSLQKLASLALRNTKFQISPSLAGVARTMWRIGVARITLDLARTLWARADLCDTVAQAVSRNTYKTRLQKAWKI